MQMIKKLQSWLSAPHLDRWIVCIVMLLALPSLWGGMQMDDYVHYFNVHGHPPDISAKPLDVFAFTPETEKIRQHLINQGSAPWFVPKNLAISFWRPISSMTHALDYHLWPNHSWLMHLENALWYVAIVFIVTRLYRRMLHPAWIGGLAALLYALDDAHSLPMGWIANRNALIAVTFGYLVLWFHIRWREDGLRRGIFWSSTMFVLGLLSAEAAIGIGAYLVSYAIFMERGTWLKRFLSLAPYGVIVILWRIIYKTLGYQTVGSGLYIDPLSDSGKFVWAFFERFPLLLLGQWGAPSADIRINLVDPKTVFILWVFAVVFLVFVFWMLRPLLRHNVLARFWTLGMILSTIPIAATFPSDRLLFFVGFGGMGLVAQFFGAIFDWPLWMPRKQVWRFLAWGLCIFLTFVHLVCAPLLFIPRSMFLKVANGFVEGSNLSIPSEPDLSHQRLIIVRSLNHFFTIYLPLMRVYHKMATPEQVVCLSAGSLPEELTRINENTLAIRPYGGFFSEPIDRLFRDDTAQTKPGEVISLDGVRIQIQETLSDGRPSLIHFEFDRPLEDPKFRWVVWEDNVYAPFKLPAVGETIHLPIIDPVKTFKIYFQGKDTP